MSLTKLKFRELFGMFLATAFVGSIQTLSASYVFMIILGILHAEWTESVAPIGYGTSVILLALVQILVVILRISVDYRSAFEQHLTPPS